MKIAILDDYLKVARKYADWSRLPADCELTIFDRPIGGADAVVAALEPFDIVCLMRERTAFRADVIERLPNLKLIVTTGRRNFSIDLDAARKRAIVVSGTPGRHQAPAELAFLHVMALARGLCEEAASMRNGGWQVRLGRELAGMRLGLLGLGGLGKQVARFALAFNMKVAAWSENLTRERAAEAGVDYVSREELFSGSDFVVVLLRLSPRTVGFVGADEIALMKRDAYLVNISRGPIVDTGALVAALEEGRIAGAGLDVYDQEPLAVDSPLRRAPNLLLTPHIGYATHDAFEIFYPETLESVLAFLAGSPIRVLEPE
jgi:phosphoglycerate dehydrogenase-like enzyme